MIRNQSRCASLYIICKQQLIQCMYARTHIFLLSYLNHNSITSSFVWRYLGIIVGAIVLILHFYSWEQEWKKKWKQQQIFQCVEWCLFSIECEYSGWYCFEQSIRFKTIESYIWNDRGIRFSSESIGNKNIYNTNHKLLYRLPFEVWKFSAKNSM